jgi:hypothetical protein
MQNAKNWFAGVFRRDGEPGPLRPKERETKEPLHNRHVPAVEGFVNATRYLGGHLFALSSGRTF